MRRLHVPAFFLLLAIAHTWPLATSPGRLSLNDNADAQLNEWILAWIAHQLPRAPGDLFSANIFYPARDTLAYSEPLIAPALMGAPLAWLGASPVLVYNVVLILGLALTAIATYAVVVEWTGDRAAGLLAGSAFAFNTHTLTRLAHVQAAHAWGLPLALLAADRLVVRGRWSDAVWLAIWISALAYTSGYLLVFGAVMTAVVILSRIREWWPRARQVLVLLAATAVLALVVTLPVSVPYVRVAQEEQMTRPLDAVTEFSATPAGYVSSAGRLHSVLWNSLPANPVDALFPGFVVLALAGFGVYALASGPGDRGRRASRVVMLLSLALTGFVLSLGTHTPVYGWLYHAFPPMQGLRAAARFGNLFLLATAVLAGIGLAAARVRLAPHRAALIAVGLVALANLESLRAPLNYVRFEGISPVYSLLAREPGSVVLVETPFYPPEGAFENAHYMLNSTAHWRPLMNGYSGYLPESYRQISARFWRFPEPDAIQAMREAGATHVIVHSDRFGADAESVLQTLAATPSLERVAIGRGVVLFRFK
jgi:hypothetical protein